MSSVEGVAEMKTGGGGEGEDSFVYQETLRSGAITFLMPRFRTGVPWSRGVGSSQIPLPEMERDESTRREGGRGRG